MLPSQPVLQDDSSTHLVQQQKHHTDGSPIPSHRAASGSPANQLSWFTLEELAAASNSFSSANVIGEGGFGPVFKGTLPDGKFVAIKQLKAGGGQGEREFQAEVETISRVHHRHLVSLTGYCVAGNQRLLVYPFVPNRTLDYHLHCKIEGHALDWPTRMRIALGAARGLAYPILTLISTEEDLHLLVDPSLQDTSDLSMYRL